MSKPLLRFGARRSSSKGQVGVGGGTWGQSPGSSSPRLRFSSDSTCLLQVAVPKELSRTACGTS